MRMKAYAASQAMSVVALENRVSLPAHDQPMKDGMDGGLRLLSTPEESHREGYAIHIVNGSQDGVRSLSCL